MTVVLDLTPDVQARAVAQARAEGVAVEEYLQVLIAASLPESPESQARQRNRERNADAIALLDSFQQDDQWGDAQEQQETLALLKEALDADRPGQRRLFGQGRNP